MPVGYNRSPAAAGWTNDDGPEAGLHRLDKPRGVPVAVGAHRVHNAQDWLRAANAEREDGAKLLARRWSVPEEKIRTWVSHYRLHGIAALQPKRSVYSAHFKLQVLTHQDRERLSSRQVAAIYDIRNPNQVVAWRRVFDGGGVAALEGKNLRIL